MRFNIRDRVNRAAVTGVAYLVITFALHVHVWWQAILVGVLVTLANGDGYRVGLHDGMQDGNHCQ